MDNNSFNKTDIQLILGCIMLCVIIGIMGCDYLILHHRPKEPLHQPSSINIDCIPEALTTTDLENGKTVVIISNSDNEPMPKEQKQKVFFPELEVNSDEDSYFLYGLVRTDILEYCVSLSTDWYIQIIAYDTVFLGNMRSVYNYYVQIADNPEWIISCLDDGSGEIHIGNMSNLYCKSSNPVIPDWVKAYYEKNPNLKK